MSLSWYFGHVVRRSRSSRKGPREGAKHQPSGRRSARRGRAAATIRPRRRPPRAPRARAAARPGSSPSAGRGATCRRSSLPTSSAPGHTRGVHSSPRWPASGTRSARSSLVMPQGVGIAARQESRSGRGRRRLADGGLVASEHPGVARRRQHRDQLGAEIVERAERPFGTPMPAHLPNASGPAGPKMCR